MRDSYGLDRDALDRWITDGRYSSTVALITCPDCEEQTMVTIESEYGGSTWDPGECKCGREFNGEEPFEDGAPEAEYDPMDEQDRRERDREFSNGDYQEEER